MKSILIVGAGSFLGGVLRYLIALLFQNKSLLTFPYPTFIVNILGCFVVGIIYGLIQKEQAIQNDWKLFLIFGFCGGFTTFSAFAIENFNLLKENSIFLFFGYTALSIAGGLFFVYLGFILAKLF